MKKVSLLLGSVLMMASLVTSYAEETGSKEKVEKAQKVDEGEIIEAAREIPVTTKPRKFIGKKPVEAAAVASEVPPIKTDKPIIPAPEIKKSPGDFPALFLKAVELEKSGQYQAAVDTYNEALAIRRDAPGAIIRKGICQVRLGKNEDGVRTILEGLDMRPVTKGDYMTMSWVKSTSPVAQLRDGTLAVVFAQRVLESGETAEGLDLLAAGYAEMGNFRQARENLLRAIKNYPDAPNMDGMRRRLELNTKQQKFREEWTPSSEEDKKLSKDVEKKSEEHGE